MSGGETLPGAIQPPLFEPTGNSVQTKLGLIRTSILGSNVPLG